MIIQPAKLRQGSGDGNPKNGLCLMQMVDWFAGSEEVTDAPACACPVLTALGIRLNDLAPSQKARNTLWPLVWRLLDSRDVNFVQLRAEHMVREVTHRIVAPIFEERWPDLACTLRAADTTPEIKEAATTARMAAWGLVTGAYVVAAVVEEAAEALREMAEALVERTEALAVVVAWEKAGAADEGDVAAEWEVVETVEEVVEEEAWTMAESMEEVVEKAAGTWAWETLREIFAEAINLGPHGEEDPVYAPRAAELRALLRS